MKNDEERSVDLDGPTAAPDHHRVVFENERVRVFTATSIEIKP